MVKITLLLITLAIFLNANVAKIIAIKGDSFSITNNKKIKLKINSQIEESSEIQTSNNSKIQLLFKDNTIITIGKNSNFKVSEYKFNEEKKEYKASFSLIKGTFRTITGKIGKIAPNKFKLNSKTSSIGIRGTQIVASIDGNSETIYCTEGEIVVISLTDGTQITLREGESLKVSTKSSTPRVKEKFDKKSLEKINPETKFTAQDDSGTTEVTQEISESVAEVSLSQIAEAKIITTDSVQEVIDLFEENNVDTSSITNVASRVNSPGFFTYPNLENILQVRTNGEIFSLSTLNFTIMLDQISSNFQSSGGTLIVGSEEGNYTVIGSNSDMGWGDWSFTGSNQLLLKGDWIYGNLTSQPDLTSLATTDSNIGYTGNLINSGVLAGTITLQINFSSGAISSSLSPESGGTYSISGTDNDLSNGYDITDNSNSLSGSFYGSNAAHTGGVYKAGSNKGVFKASKN